MPDLSRKIVLVTGASSGIGGAVARISAERGASVGALSRSISRLESLRAELGETCVIRACDVSDPRSVDRAVSEVIERTGVPDLVVNSAGVIEPLPLASCTPEAWSRTLDVNLSGTYYVSRATALRMLEAEGGSIVNIGSDLATVGASDRVSYCASKAGVLGLTRALAVELAPRVRVNAVCPGPVDTPMLLGEHSVEDNPDQARRDLIDQVPLRRLATPEEIARLVLHVGLENSFITGAALNVDGGMTIA